MSATPSTPAAAAASSPRPIPEAPRHFGLIIVGDEIMSGKRADKHMPKVIELLGARGLQLAWADYVGDSPERIEATLARAFALGEPLQLHPRAADLIRERMQDVAREQGVPYEPERDDNVHRLNMGVFPASAQIIPNPYNKIPGFTCVGQGGGAVHFVPGFPVMAWPMVEWVLDTHYAHLFNRVAHVEKSVIVFGSMEATLTPLMEAIEREHAGVKVFSLPSVDHPQYGRHIELGVKGDPTLVLAAYPALLAGLHRFDLKLGPELVR